MVKPSVTVQDLLTRPFSCRPMEDQKLIVACDKPRPSLSMSAVTFSEKDGIIHLDFETAMYDKIPWLTGCERKQSFFCWPCLLFAKPAVWNCVGVSDILMLMEGASEHEKTSDHIDAVISLQLFKKRLLSSHSQEADQPSWSEETSNKEVLKIKVKTTANASKNKNSAFESRSAVYRNLDFGEVTSDQKEQNRSILIAKSNISNKKQMSVPLPAEAASQPSAAHNNKQFLASPPTDAALQSTSKCEKNMLLYTKTFEIPVQYNFGREKEQSITHQPITSHFKEHTVQQNVSQESLTSFKKSAHGVISHPTVQSTVPQSVEVASQPIISCERNQLLASHPIPVQLTVPQSVQVPQQPFMSYGQNQFMVSHPNTVQFTVPQSAQVAQQPVMSRSQNQLMASQQNTVQVSVQQSAQVAQQPIMSYGQNHLMASHPNTVLSIVSQSSQVTQLPIMTYGQNQLMTSRPNTVELSVPQSAQVTQQPIMSCGQNQLMASRPDLVQSTVSQLFQVKQQPIIKRYEGKQLAASHPSTEYLKVSQSAQVTQQPIIKHYEGKQFAASHPSTEHLRVPQSAQVTQQPIIKHYEGKQFAASHPSTEHLRVPQSAQVTQQPIMSYGGKRLTVSHSTTAPHQTTLLPQSTENVHNYDACSFVDTENGIMKRLIDACVLTFQLNRSTEFIYSDQFNREKCMNALKLLKNCDSIDAKLSTAAVNLVKQSPEHIDSVFCALVKVVQSAIKKEVYSARHVSVIINQHAINCSKSIVSYILRYMNNGEVCERFIGFTPISCKLTYESLYKYVFDTLLQYEIAKKICAISLDGTLLNPDELPKFLIKIKGAFPHCFFVPWHSHSLSSILQQSLSTIADCRQFFKSIANIQAYLRDNSESLESFVREKHSSLSFIYSNSSHLAYSSIKRQTSPRFIFFVKQYRQNLIDLFSSITKRRQIFHGDAITKALGFHSYLKQLQTVFLLEVFYRLFDVTHDFDASLKSNSFGFNDGKMVRSLVNKITKMPIDKFHTVWYCVEKETSRELNLTNLFKEKKPKYLSLFDAIVKLTANELCIRYKPLDKLSFCSMVNFSLFGEMDPVRSCISNLVLNNLGSLFDEKKLYYEFLALFQNHNPLPKTLMELYQFLRNRNLQTFPVLYSLAEFIIAMPFTPVPENGNTSKLEQIERWSEHPKWAANNVCILDIEHDIFQTVKQSSTFHDTVLSVHKTLLESLSNYHIIE